MANNVAPQPKTAPNFVLPGGACDCHVHVVGDLARYPQAADRPFSYAPADTEDLLRMLRALHLERVVLVNPIVYRTNNDYMVNALRALGPRARGIAVIDTESGDAELMRLDAAGVRGVRLFPRSVAEMPRLMAVADRIRPLRWHMQIFIVPSVFAECRAELSRLGLPLVLDHFAGALARDGVHQAGFAEVLAMLRDGAAWLKISGFHRASEMAPDFPDLRPLIDALLRAAPENLVWGNDWPHPMVGAADSQRSDPARIVPWGALDDGHELNLLARFIPDEALRNSILSRNPARLYGF